MWLKLPHETEVPYDLLIMIKPIRKTHPLLGFMSNALIDLPAPINLSYMWGFGSIVGLCLVVQILTGLILAIQYTAHIDYAFRSVIHYIRDVYHGWLIRNIHANMASFFFICIYIHIGRGLYYISFASSHVWEVGVVLLVLTIGAAFIGYVLVWGQIRFWGARVIRNLLTAIPYMGNDIAKWVWGGFAVGNPTLIRFFSFHFVLPFIIIAFVLIHLIFLHTDRSREPLGGLGMSWKVPFHWYFTIKDLLGFCLLGLTLLLVVILDPNLFIDPDNFTPANPMVTPAHIKPEWYFLWAYSILRSIPNKLGGVLRLAGAIIALLSLKIISYKGKRKGIAFYPINQFLFWWFITTVLLLTWNGGSLIEYPHDIIGLWLVINYFSYFFLSRAIIFLWDKFIIN